MIKRLFTVSAMIAIALSCQKESVRQTGTGIESVQIAVALPETLTRSISDGESADIVYWAGFDDAGTAVDGLNGSAPVNGRFAEFDVKLVKHYTYSFVFWAQDADSKAYDLSAFASQGKIGVSYEGSANDESRDAFYKQEDIMIQSSGETKNIVLSRPFAQINFLAADYKSVEDVDVHKSLKSTVSISGLPTVLNGLDGSVEGSGATVLVPAAVPTDPAYFIVNEVEYGWYSMNYILAAEEKNLNVVTAVFSHDKSEYPVEVEVSNVPYQRNHRTNIIGNFLTEMAEVKVIVMEGFDDPANNIDEEGNPIQ